MAASKVIAKDKNTFSVRIKVNVIASIDVILICPLGNDLKDQKQYPEGSVEKVLLKLSQKSQETICDGVFFKIKIHAGALSLYYKETLVLAVFVNPAKFLKTLSKNFGNVCERLLLRVITFESLFL